MKKILFILFLFFFCFSAFCVGGNVFHHKKLYTIKTQYFDINFDGETLDDAKKIACVADSYYLEITKKFGSEPYLRFPVTLTREVESLNGFYSPFPYNMIVLYVAEPDSPEMESYNDTLLSVFYHELSHAVTLNMKSPTFKKLSKIFGDFASPVLFSMPYFWIEGAAVFSESTIQNENPRNYADSTESAENFGGRLKNPYFTSLLVQAKINDEAGIKKFPSWRDVLGARDTTPGGSDRYVFGGCFAEYLAENFGMEKYAELWKNAGDSTNLAFSAGVFKKTYGRKIDDVWNDFKNSITVQENAYKNGFDKLSQRSDENSPELVSRKNAFVSALDVFYDEKSNLEKIVFYDSSSRKVYFEQKNLDDESQKKSRQKKLFSAAGITNLRFSDDGEKIFVTRYVAKKTVRIENGFFDIKTKKYEVLKNSNDFDKVNHHNENQNLRKSPIWAKSSYENQVSIEKNALSWKIVFNQKKYSPELPENEKIMLVNPHFLKSDEKTAFISFSWAKFASKNDDFKNLELPKVGILKINLETNEAKFYLQKNALFAGLSIHAVNDAALLSAGKTGTKILAVLEDFEQNPLYEIALPPLEDENKWEKLDVRLETLEDNNLRKSSKSAEEKNPAESAEKPDFEVKNFSSLSYLLRGTKLPVGIVPLKNDDFETCSAAVLGATYITSKPYLDDILILSAGYDFFYDDAGLLLNYFASDESSSFSLSSSVLFDSDIFKQAAENLTYSKTLWRGLVSSFSAGFMGDVVYGRTAEEDFEISAGGGEKIAKKGELWKQGFFTKDTFFLTFSNARKVAPKRNQIFGFTFQPFLDFEYKSYNEEWEIADSDDVHYTMFSAVFSNSTKDSSEKIEEKYLNAGVTLISRIPGIFPLTLTASVFPSSKYFAYGSAKANLLELEIQKGIPAVSVYAARFDLNLLYFGRISYDHGDFWDISKAYGIARDIEKDDYSDQISLSALFTLSPNTGYMADSSLQFKIGASVFYRPNVKDGQSRAGFGISVSIDN